MSGLDRHFFGITVQFGRYFTVCEVWDSRNSVTEDLSLLGCYIVSTGKLFLMFWCIVVLKIPEDLDLLC